MKKIITSPKAPAALGPYSHGTVHNGTLYVSGQLPLVPETGEILQGDIAAQTTLVMNHIKSIVEEAGSDMANVLKCTILLTDLGNFTKVNEAYAKFFPENPPARICYQVCALPRGADVEIDAICAL